MAREHLELNSFQKNYLDKVRQLEPSDPFLPWNNRIVIPGAGILAVGWTNDNYILVISNDGYAVFDPINGTPKVEMNKLGTVYHLFAANNLSFEVPELNEVVRVFGIYGGDGNHVTSDGWGLELIYPAWPNSAVLLRKPSLSVHREVWEEVKIISLKRLEYIELKCGFSNNGKHFLIVGGGGIEIFSR